MRITFLLLILEDGVASTPWAVNHPLGGHQAFLRIIRRGLRLEHRLRLRRGLRLEHRLVLRLRRGLRLRLCRGLRLRAPAPWLRLRLRRGKL